MSKTLTFQKLIEQDYGGREAYNSLRTNLSFCGADIKVVMFTSCTPNEGKSTVTLELARSLGEDGKKVVLVDADLRKSVMVGHNGIVCDSEIFGLSHFLAGQKKEEDVIYNTNIPNVDVILAGHVVPNPTELLNNHHFEELMANLKERYDMVLVDCPPVGWVIDAAVVAPKCDGTIIVIESGNDSYRFLQDIKKQLELTGCKILGAVINKVEVGKSGYYNHYYGGKYGKYGKYSKYGEYGGEKWGGADSLDESAPDTPELDRKT